MDMERHCPMDLLPDRTSDTLAAWLKEHTGIEVLSRDREKDYAEGGRGGARSDGGPASYRPGRAASSTFSTVGATIVAQARPGPGVQ